MSSPNKGKILGSLKYNEEYFRNKNVHHQIANQYRLDALKNKTKAEVWAEEILLNNFESKKFVVQCVYKFRRFDFFFPLIKTAIEIDGSIHLNQDTQEYDKACDLYLLQRFNIKVLRVTNFDLIKMMDVVKDVKMMMSNPEFRHKKYAKKLKKRDKRRERKSKRRAKRKIEHCLGNTEDSNKTKTIKKKPVYPKIVKPQIKAIRDLAKILNANALKK